MSRAEAAGYIILAEIKVNKMFTYLSFKGRFNLTQISRSFKERERDRESPF